MNIKLCSLLHKSYIREKKFLRVLSLLCCVSMTLLLVFNYFTEISSMVMEQSIEKDCGKYDIIVGNIQKADITKIKKMENVVSYHVYLEEEVR